MAGQEWDWFQREELIGHISDIRVQNLQEVISGNRCKSGNLMEKRRGGCKEGISASEKWEGQESPGTTTNESNANEDNFVKN
ncbi:hypothetical protein llap_4280 [Limosa lapponica baueri]|uniref:Uncharacterized protein n=1 Tax=Limosa lapponica baueri TaxID=1758121 RepID=A0A2I0UH65_LIMLA|nr:hypothetical protein llap_4280 [Limosa lapponica baueri]